MNNLMTVRTLGPQLIALLGMPKNVRSFELSCSVDEIVTVKCEYYPEVAYGIDTVLAEYELVPRIAAQVAAHRADIIGFDAWMHDRAEAAHQVMMTQVRVACAAGLCLRSVVPGDKVVLRSGGTEMTVLGITYDGSQVACKWIADGLMQGDSFAPECLARCVAQ